MAHPPNEIMAFLAGYPAVVRDLAAALRTTIRSAMPDAQEMLDEPGKIIGYGYGKGYSDLICTIIPSQAGVKLGLVGGVDLPDPKGLLEGVGKRHRYVVFEKSADLRKPGLKPLLDAAHAAWKQRKGC